MKKQNCDIEIQENLFNSVGRVNWKHFVEIMAAVRDYDISAYTMAKNTLKDAGILGDQGYAVKAFGILNRNPREAVNCGKQLYFSGKLDSMLYAKALEKTGDLNPGEYTFEHVGVSNS